MSRGVKSFEISRGGVSPVETVLVESCVSGRRIAPSTVIRIAKYRHDSARGSRRLEIVCSDSGSGLVPGLSGLKRNSLCGSYLRRAGRERGLLSVNSL